MSCTTLPEMECSISLSKTISWDNTQSCFLQQLQSIKTVRMHTSGLNKTRKNYEQINIYFLNPKSFKYLIPLDSITAESITKLTRIVEMIAN